MDLCVGVGLQDLAPDSLPPTTDARASFIDGAAKFAQIRPQACATVIQDLFTGAHYEHKAVLFIDTFVNVGDWLNGFVTARNSLTNTSAFFFGMCESQSDLDWAHANLIETLTGLYKSGELQMPGGAKLKDRLVGASDTRVNSSRFTTPPTLKTHTHTHTRAHTLHPHAGTHTQNTHTHTFWDTHSSHAHTDIVPHSRFHVDLPGFTRSFLDHMFSLEGCGCQQPSQRQELADDDTDPLPPRPGLHHLVFGGKDKDRDLAN